MTSPRDYDVEFCTYSALPNWLSGTNPSQFCRCESSSTSQIHLTRAGDLALLAA